MDEKITKYMNEHEEKTSAYLHERVTNTSSSYFNLINLIKENTSNLGLNSPDISNLSIVTNNSLYYLEDYFKKNNSYLLTVYIKDIDFCKTSVVGAAICEDIFSNMEKGTILINDYSNCLIKIADRKQNDIDVASNMSKISRVVFRDEFAKQVSKVSSVSTEEKEELSDIRKKYSNIVNYIYNYDSNIEKNIVPALLAYFEKSCSTEFTNIESIEYDKEEAINTLKQLGFENLVSEFDSKVSEIKNRLRKKNISNSDFNEEHHNDLDDMFDTKTATISENTNKKI